MNHPDIINAWKQAGADLNIRIRASFILENAEQDECLFLVENFGSKKGTLVFTTDNTGSIHKAQKQGYYCSALNPSLYSVYDRNYFIETLTDWGFYGAPELRPDWYAGHVYK